MGIVQSHCSVLFVPRTNESNWIQIGEHGGNWSYVGQIGGGQQILDLQLELSIHHRS